VRAVEAIGPANPCVSHCVAMANFHGGAPCLQGTLHMEPNSKGIQNDSPIQIGETVFPMSLIGRADHNRTLCTFTAVNKP
jgi:hypothetical protein